METPPHRTQSSPDDQLLPSLLLSYLQEINVFRSLLREPPWDDIPVTTVAFPNSLRCPPSTKEILEEQFRVAHEELNHLQVLLGAHPLGDFSFAPHSPQAKEPASNSAFEELPTEILDRIASYLDLTSFLSLCHSVPFFKYASELIHTVGISLNLNPYELWPDFEFPVDLEYGWMPASIPTKHLVKVHNYSRFLARFGGVVQIPMRSNARLKSIRVLLPRTVDVLVSRGCEKVFEGSLSKGVQSLQRSGILVRCMNIPNWVSDKEIEGILTCGNVARFDCSELEGTRFNHSFPLHALKRSHALKEIKLRVSVLAGAAALKTRLRELLGILSASQVERVSFESREAYSTFYLPLFRRFGTDLALEGWRMRVMERQNELRVVWARLEG
ncbi:hypothetical protein HDU98_009586 [Podochytrium sp. JEL0797]|nr:hypothetical protein HDU98_009586 [Podochytrium sp. JEL0797]